MKRDYKKLKSIEDYAALDDPIHILERHKVTPPQIDQAVLRVLVRPKYGELRVPKRLTWLKKSIIDLAIFDKAYTGINASWCYVTVRHGLPFSLTDDEWHFDGPSFRVDTVPERNYVWTDHSPTEYKSGNLTIPDNFDPLKHNLNVFAAGQLEGAEVKACGAKKWYLLNPFCLHRRPPNIPNIPRTFIRVSFLDIEIRDINNTPNPHLATDAFGRNPVETFRNKLIPYK